MRTPLGKYHPLLHTGSLKMNHGSPVLVICLVTGDNEMSTGKGTSAEMLRPDWPVSKSIEMFS